MLVSQLEGAELDFWVAKAEGHKIVKVEYKLDGRDWLVVFRGSPDDFRSRWFPSTDWSQGGPIIEKEDIEIGLGNPNDPPGISIVTKPVLRWANCHGKIQWAGKKEPLIAAMRARVVAVFGEEVE